MTLYDLGFSPSSSTSTLRRTINGTAWGVAAAALWGGWWVISRHAVLTGFSAIDLTALRFGVSGLILLPVLFSAWRAVLGAPLGALLLLAVGAGAPYSLTAATGLRAISAGNGGALLAGLVPAFTALLIYLRHRQMPGVPQRIGLTAILLGAFLLVGSDLLSTPDAPTGVLFLTAGALLWAGFTLAMRAAGLAPLEATSVICVASGAVILPLYVAAGAPALAAVPLMQVAMQALFQGVLSALAAVYCYNRAIVLLGPARAAVFVALVPVMATVIGAFALGEVPDGIEILGVVVVSAGVAATAQGPAPSRFDV